MFEKEEESFNPFINAALVVRIRIQDLGRLEEYIAQIKGAELFYVEKALKTVKLRIVKEMDGIEIDRNSNDFREKR
jgi:hypothetical protein